MSSLTGAFRGRTSYLGREATRPGGSAVGVRKPVELGGGGNRLDYLNPSVCVRCF